MWQNYREFGTTKELFTRAWLTGLARVTGLFRSLLSVVLSLHKLNSERSIGLVEI